MLVVALVCLSMVGHTASGDTQVFVIHDDAGLNQAVAQARADFLAIKPYVSRLDVTLLVPNPDGSWSRGSYNPNAIAYPASCVKLCYLASAMYWSRINGHPYDYLDWCVRPMIAESDNYATGEVVDAITGAPNYPATVYDAAFWEWYALRLFTENYLTARGLLENQTVLHKTYPTNSGSSPAGAEGLAFDYRGGNRMQPKCSASLMLEIVKGAIEPGATAYMRELLTSDPRGGDSEFGFGLPPGALYENKLGLAYDTLEDIAYIVLPNGRQFILAAYSNGFQGPEPGQPYPWDGSLLGVFCEMMIDELELSAGCPPKVKIDNEEPVVEIVGDWEVVTDQIVDYDMYGPSYLSTAGTQPATASVRWNLNVPTTGRYEVCVWSPQKTTGTIVTYEVQHAGGSAFVGVDQRDFGGRWYPLGDFDFAAGQGAVVLTNEVNPPNRVVMADAVKITKWPSGELFDDDADGEIDASDFAGFTNCMSGPDGGPVDGPCANHDADGDDDVDLADFAELQVAFGA
jgi:protein phosphatase methylesterase 1